MNVLLGITKNVSQSKPWVTLTLHASLKSNIPEAPVAEFTHYIYAVLHCKPAKHFQNAASGCEWLSSASAMHVCACMCLFVCLFVLRGKNGIIKEKLPQIMTHLRILIKSSFYSCKHNLCAFPYAYSWPWKEASSYRKWHGWKMDKLQWHFFNACKGTLSDRGIR